jgi:hypothetical protein
MSTPDAVKLASREVERVRKLLHVAEVDLREQTDLAAQAIVDRDHLDKLLPQQQMHLETFDKVRQQIEHAKNAVIETKRARKRALDQIDFSTNSAKNAAKRITKHNKKLVVAKSVLDALLPDLTDLRVLVPKKQLDK